MNIIDKVSKFHRAQNVNSESSKQNLTSAPVAFAEIRKGLPLDVKNKVFELHQKFAGVKEATIYNLMKKHEFKYNLVENELKMLVVSKRNFNPQGQIQFQTPRSTDKNKETREEKHVNKTNFRKEKQDCDYDYKRNSDNNRKDVRGVNRNDKYYDGADGKKSNRDDVNGEDSHYGNRGEKRSTTNRNDDYDDRDGDRLNGHRVEPVYADNKEKVDDKDEDRYGEKSNKMGYKKNNRKGDFKDERKPDKGNDRDIDNHDDGYGEEDHRGVDREDKQDSKVDRYNDRKGYNGSSYYKNDKSYGTYKNYSYNSERYKSGRQNYTSNSRKPAYNSTAYKYIKKTNDPAPKQAAEETCEQNEVEQSKIVENKVEHQPKLDAIEKIPVVRIITELPANEEVNNKISDDKDLQKIGLFAKHTEEVPNGGTEKALGKLITTIEDNIMHYFTNLHDYNSSHKNPDTFVGDKLEQPQSHTKLPTDSKYKKKQIEVGKEFKNDIDESSSHFRSNKVDLLIKKNFESEEEKLKSTREKKLEKKIDDLGEIIKTMQLRINSLEMEIRNKEGTKYEGESKFQSNVYCMVPFNVVKGLFSQANGTNSNPAFGQDFKCFTMNLNDS